MVERYSRINGEETWESLCGKFKIKNEQTDRDKMKCPLCNAATDVKHTKDGLRTRECFNLHRFRTQEVVVSEPKPKRKWKIRDRE
jgi:hypothetical protein